MNKRAFLRTGALLTASTIIPLGCALPGPAPDMGGASPGAARSTPTPTWKNRLGGTHIVLLGELHDHHGLHAARLALLREAIAAGWRPAVVMEQFDTDRQDALDRARGARPDDADYLIAEAGERGGAWEWPLYRPVIDLALRQRLPLFAGNLARSTARRVITNPLDQVFSATERARLRLDRAIAPDWSSAQEREMDLGHCGAVPGRLLPGLARAQFTRDALMAALLREHAAHGAVLLAGNGHVRRDLGVARWLDDLPAERVWSVGFLPLQADATAPTPRPAQVAVQVAPHAAAQFDAVVTAARLSTEAVRSTDPCEGLPEQFRRR